MRAPAVFMQCVSVKAALARLTNYNQQPLAVSAVTTIAGAVFAAVGAA